MLSTHTQSKGSKICSCIYKKYLHVGDLRLAVADLSAALGSWRFNANSEWWSDLREKCRVNRTAAEGTAEDVSVPLNYYATVKIKGLHHGMPQINSFSF